MPAFTIDSGVLPAPLLVFGLVPADWPQLASHRGAGVDRKGPSGQLPVPACFPCLPAGSPHWGLTSQPALPVLCCPPTLAHLLDTRLVHCLALCPAPCHVLSGLLTSSTPPSCTPSCFCPPAASAHCLTGCCCFVLLPLALQDVEPTWDNVAKPATACPLLCRCLSLLLLLPPTGSAGH